MSTGPTFGWRGGLVAACFVIDLPELGLVVHAELPRDRETLQHRSGRRAAPAARGSPNKNTVPFDPEKPFVTSGIRLGTPSVTTRGTGIKEMETIADFIDRALKNRKSDEILADIAREVARFSEQYPLYTERLQETI